MSGFLPDSPTVVVDRGLNTWLAETPAWHYPIPAHLLPLRYAGAIRSSVLTLECDSKICLPGLGSDDMAVLLNKGS